MVSNTGAIGTGWEGQAANASAPSAADKLTNKDTFLKLLVAQVRNQNPLNPADGVEFLTQLAQFTQLEQSLGMREELEAIRRLLETQADGTGGAIAGGSTDNTEG